MNWCDQKLGFDQTPPPSAEQVEARLAGLPMEDLVWAWREVSNTGLKGQTEGTHAFMLYFDRLSHDTPERGIAFLEAELAHEPDDEIVMLLASGKVLGQLLVFHAPRAAPALQALALRQSGLRWLLGSQAASIANGMVENPEARRRLLAIADEASYHAWREQRPKPEAPVPDFAAMKLPDLAAAWVEITSRSDLARERDEAWSALFDFQSDLVNNDPLKALELVKAIVDIEDNPYVLGLLAAGMLEDLIPAEDGPVVDEVVAEAARNPRFRHLLGGVWFSGMSPEIVERLEKAREGVSW